MKELSNKELEKVAEVYEELLAPALFESWSNKMIDLAQIRPNQNVLDVACGTGRVARKALTRVEPDGYVTGIDNNPGMLAVAERIAPQVEWQEGSAENMPMEDNFYDAVICQFGLMLFSDPIKSLKEMMRVLKPEGRLAVAVFDSLDNIPAYKQMSDTYNKVIGKEVGDALRIPFSMGDVNEIANLFNDADINDYDIKSHYETVKFPSLKSFVLSDTKGWFPFAGIILNEKQIENISSEAEKSMSNFINNDGSIQFDIGIHSITSAKN